MAILKPDLTFDGVSTWSHRIYHSLCLLTIPNKPHRVGVNVQNYFSPSIGFHFSRQLVGAVFGANKYTVAFASDLSRLIFTKYSMDNILVSTRNLGIKFIMTTTIIIKLRVTCCYIMALLFNTWKTSSIFHCKLVIRRDRIRNNNRYVDWRLELTVFRYYPLRPVILFFSPQTTNTPKKLTTKPTSSLSNWSGDLLIRKFGTIREEHDPELW